MGHELPRFDRALFLEGPPGTGKTSAAISFVSRLVEAGADPASVLVLLPCASPALPYRLDRLSGWSRFGISVIDFYTFLHTASELLAGLIGDLSPSREPGIFLTHQQALFHMSRLAAPLFETGSLRGIRLSPEQIIRRIYQLHETAMLSKLRLTDISERTKGYFGQQANGVPDTHETIVRIIREYRESCIAHNYYDYPLIADLFVSHLVDTDAVTEAFHDNYDYLVVDNIEEMSVCEHDFVFWAMENVRQSLVVYDAGGGYHPSSDPANAQQFRDVCDNRLFWPADEDSVENTWRSTILVNNKEPSDDPAALWQKHLYRFPFYANMPSVCSEYIADLQRDDAASIAVILPFLTESLETMFLRSLESRSAGAFVYNPPYPLSRSPLIQAIITLLAEYLDPQQLSTIPSARMLRVLQTLIEGLDPIRAHLLVQLVYRKGVLHRLDVISGNLRDRLPETLRERYNALYEWLEAAKQSFEYTPLDSIIARFGDEVLIQPGFILHDSDIPRNWLSAIIQQGHDFRQHFHPNSNEAWSSPNREFRDFVQSDFSTADFVSGEAQTAGVNVVITSVNHYLTGGLSSDYQFWVDVSNPAWRHNANDLLWSAGELRTHSTPEVDRETDRPTRNLAGLLSHCKREFFLLESQRSVNGREYSQIGRTRFFNLFRAVLEKTSG